VGATLSYFVTFGKLGPAARDPGDDKPLNLGEALSRAYQMLDVGMRDVAIRDDKGNSIGGEDLMACWRGDKEATSDLKAVPSPSRGERPHTGRHN
jgi:hypothetical protein